MLIIICVCISSCSSIMRSTVLRPALSCSVRTVEGVGATVTVGAGFFSTGSEQTAVFSRSVAGWSYGGCPRRVISIKARFKFSASCCSCVEESNTDDACCCCCGRTVAFSSTSLGGSGDGFTFAYSSLSLRSAMTILRASKDTGSMRASARPDSCRNRIASASPSSLATGCFGVPPMVVFFRCCSFFCYRVDRESKKSAEVTGTRSRR